MNCSYDIRYIHDLSAKKTVTSTSTSGTTTTTTTTEEYIMQNSGDIFTITEAGVIKTISDSTCKKMPNNEGITSTASVSRATGKLTITFPNSTATILDLVGDSISSTYFDTQDDNCKIEKSNIHGDLDYAGKTLIWYYNIKITEIDNCPEAEKND